MREVPFGRPLIGDEERNAVEEVLRGYTLVHGPKAKEFESAFGRFIGTDQVTSVSSCTAGLHLSYFHLGIGNGDEVIVPAQTHTATAHAVELVGAKPIFVDAELSTGNIDIDAIPKAITEKTKAICVVHYLGMPVDMDRINALASEHGLKVIEDCALAVGTKYNGVHAGLLGDFGSFSFYPVKHMTTGEGGIISSKHETAIKLLNRQKAFGVDRTVAERSIPGVYDVTILGFNYRMSEIHAAIGVEQVKRLEFILQRRKENFFELLSGISDLEEFSTLQSTHGKFESSYYCFNLILKKSLAEKRLALVKFLNAQGIGTSNYYPRPVPHFSYYSLKYGYSEHSFPNAARISYDSVALPVGAHLDSGDMQYMVKMLKRACSEVLK